MPSTLPQRPATSPDLNVMDYYFERQVERESPQTELDLIMVTKKVIRNLRLESSRKAIDNFPKRIDLCLAAEENFEQADGHFEHKK